MVDAVGQSEDIQLNVYFLTYRYARINKLKSLQNFI